MRGFRAYSQMSQRKCPLVSAVRGIRYGPRDSDLLHASRGYGGGRRRLLATGICSLPHPKGCGPYLRNQFQEGQGQFVFKVEGIENQFETAEIEEDGMKYFFDFMINLALKNYRNGLKEFVERDERKPIGFLAVAREDKSAPP